MTTPAVPTVTTADATCAAAGTATITNYDATVTYTFDPSGPSVGTDGAITGATAGTAYTVTAGNTTCTSAASASFTTAAQFITPVAPTGDAVQIISVPNANDATIEDIIVTGSNGLWYASIEDAIAGTNALPVGTILISGNTYYTVNVSPQGCVSTPFAVTVTVTLGNENFELSDLKYYPNPVLNLLTISAKEPISRIEIYNMLGQNILTLTPNQFEVEVNLSELQNAMYIVKVLSNDKIKIINILKK